MGLGQAAGVVFMRGMSHAISGELAQKQEVITWRCAGVVIPMFRNVIVPRGCGLIAKTV